MDGLSFGTSGLRGLVTALEGRPSHAYTLAFLRYLDEERSAGAKRRLYCGRDLRSSSPGILATCLAAAADAGFEAVDCGALPTPALAYAALEDGCPAIMVTGSHIPDDRNGLKFYGRDGEITKRDEAGIRRAFEGITQEMPERRDGARHPAISVDPAAGERYARRYLDFFPEDALAGSRIGVFTHSSVARDLLLEVMSSLGAEVTDLGRSDSFVPVDTEAHRPEDIARILDWAKDGSFDAVVSTDGDGDRPLIADETGRILRGDIIGLLTARHFGLTTIVTPITSSSAIETSAVADRVVRTKVGSPFVIEGMARAAREGADGGIAGFEANGGFMLFSDLRHGDRMLSALPTRDALLPILAVLVEARRLGSPVGGMVAALGAGHAAAHRLQEVPMEATQAFLDRLSADAAFREAFFAFVGTPTEVDDMDGCKIAFSHGRSIHFRRSGNAPELRCYVEARTEAEAHELLDQSLHLAGEAIKAR